MAAKLLTDTTAAYAEHGGAYYILGAITLRDAEEQVNAAKRQVLDLVAARYLEEARGRGVPNTVSTNDCGSWAALHDAGRYPRSISILNEALEVSQRPDGAAIHYAGRLLLNLQPPKLAEGAGSQSQIPGVAQAFPASTRCRPPRRSRILLAQKDTAAARAVSLVKSSSSPLHPEAVILHGRILVESLSARGGVPPAEAITVAAAMQDQLQRLLSAKAFRRTIAAQAHLLIGLLYRVQGDTKAAIAQFDRIRRTVFRPARGAGRDDFSRRPGPT